MFKQYVAANYTMHSFRHSIRERPRAVEYPSDVIDQIGGWAKGSVRQGYGREFTKNLLNLDVYKKGIELSYLTSNLVR